jgi:uncharacterized protein (TIGR03435 family)
MFLFAVSSSSPQSSTTQANAVNLSVVSVRPSSPDGRSYFEITNDGITERSNSLLWLVQLAYGIPSTKFVLGAPAWISTQRFDISAKIDDEHLAEYAAMKQEEKLKLLQAVLKDRFQLQTHEETRMFPQYVLRVAKGGPKPELRLASPDQQLIWKVSARYHLEARRAKIADLCYMVLSTEAQEMVVDQTGLTGTYDFDLSWRRPESGDATGSTSDAPEIFDAVKQQLGLEMIRERVPTRVLVIETIMQPSAN